ESEIGAQNQELQAQTEELGSQTEELQSQTEELQAQAEELRQANEQLGQRELMLESLLNISRSLSVGERLAQGMEKGCAAVGALLGPQTAAAIVEKTDDMLVVRGHHGFGKAGPLVHRWSVEGSFASIVMLKGQTGYLEDVAQRPDLHVPQPSEGPPFRSLLA